MYYAVWFKAVIAAFCVPIFIVGIVGNGLVVALVVRRRAMRTPTNIFITQLAVADLIILAFCMPFTVTSVYITEDWVFGEALCKVVMFFQTFPVLMSVLTLTAMSFERYLVILHPMTAKQRWTPGAALRICAVIVLIATAGSLPRPLLAGMLYLHDGLSWQPIDSANSTSSTAVVPVLYCFEDVPATFPKYYNGARIALFYVVPFVIMGVIYTRLACFLRHSHADIEQGANATLAMRRRRLAKVTRMFVAMVVVFAVCWLPYQAFLLVQALDNSREIFRSEWFQKSMVFVSIMMYGHCISNPILYSFMNSQYRKGFKRLLCHCNCDGSQTMLDSQSSSRSSKQASNREGVGQSPQPTSLGKPQHRNSVQSCQQTTSLEKQSSSQTTTSMASSSQHTNSLEHSQTTIAVITSQTPQSVGGIENIASEEIPAAQALFNESSPPPAATFTGTRRPASEPPRSLEEEAHKAHTGQRSSCHVLGGPGQTAMGPEDAAEEQSKPLDTR